ncbi:VSP [Giardia duodenalis]|uniref:VSP n=1 Tax=Giardia intestinalis (strain ATCC 50803 / WB clone C6) TaxID=184922 RepID=A8B5B4_GIAIC|nr:VSP [Giardia intestinalis]XP_037901983.1 VSP [Giardia intestinalis]KAE8303879.1 VSP [Giardia intestinalis]KAE8303880.1 VSP [Giardia intestinalis]|eukprot:XP_001709823.1 VSP [Giardia lamblia ATCC 50803]
MLLVAFYFVLSALAAACKQAQNCANERCEMVGETEICTECKDQGNVPVNGVCMPKDNDAVTTAGCKKNGGADLGAEDKVCGQCDGVHFLYKGGCYSTADATGQKLCTDAAEGVCSAAAVGYFIPPGAQKTDQSVILCGDVTEITLTNGKKYKGVQHCTVCTAPEAAESTAKPAVCTACDEGFFAASEGTCTACADNNNCAKCDAGADKCTKCKATAANKYFKDSGDGTGTCVNEQTCKEQSTHFPKDDPNNGNKCLSCSDDKSGGIADCKTCTPKENSEGPILITCSACATDTNKPNVAGTKCIACTVKDCKKCNDDGTCAECDNTRKLTPTKECVDKCEKLEGYFDGDDGTCRACNSVCKTCNGEDPYQCTGCPAKKVLKYTVESTPDSGSTCVDECTTNTNGCAECGATIGEAKYCSKCSDAKQAPLNGNCTASVRAAASCTQIENGICKKCATNYFLFEGGCYETTRQPGMQICKDAAGNDGKCKTCANNLPSNIDTGACPSCPAGCATCTAAGQTYTCQTCLAGYYLDSTKNLCIKCTESSGNIQGVTNCVSCNPPAGNSGPVTCYVKKDGTSDGGNDNSTGGSTNKSGLSTGAIAGISVAVIVVVGGLIGFLCWWFICRGKA